MIGRPSTTPRREASVLGPPPARLVEPAQAEHAAHGHDQRARPEDPEARRERGRVDEDRREHGAATIAAIELVEQPGDTAEGLAGNDAREHRLGDHLARHEPGAADHRDHDRATSTSLPA